MSENKSFRVLLSILLAASLTGCGSSAESGSAEKPQEEEETVEEEEPAQEEETAAVPEISPEDQIYHVGDTVTTDEFIFTVTDLGLADSVSLTPDDTFFLKSDGSGLSAGEGKVFLYYSVDYQYIGSYANDFMNPFLVDEYDIGNMGFLSSFVSVFRKASEEWKVNVFSGDGRFQSLPDYTGCEIVNNYEYEPSDQKYQARGVIYVDKANLDKGTITVEINDYDFEVSE